MSSGQDPYTIDLAPGAERELKALPPAVASTILQEVEIRLSTDPFKVRKTRIKRLVGFNPPLYRLRVGDYRAYYRIDALRVVILAVLHKKNSDQWLKRRG